MAEYIRMSRMADREDPEVDHDPELRLAVLGDSSTQPLCRVLKSALREIGFKTAIFESEFDSIALEVHDAESALYAFAPEFVVLYLSSQAVRSRLYALATDEQASLPHQYLAELESILRVLSERGCRVIVNTLPWPQERHFGNYSVAVPVSPLSVIQAINRGIIELASRESGIQLNDLAYLAARIGLDSWYEEKLWAQAKYACALAHLPAVARNISRIVATAKGRVIKCLVLDLDNTIWGGVVGDDGVEGLELEEGPIGEAYTRFQSYLLELRKRGIVLAVCSKNDEANAKGPFERHSGMRLRIGDIAVFVANWNDKASNIRYIAETLNLGLESFLFIDDSAFEREQVRLELPEVSVPELPEDPAMFAVFLESSGYFDSLGFTEEDVTRAEMYRDEARRSEVQLTYGNIDEYLSSLEMELRISPFDEEHLQRIEQLLQRSNQFNLCTRRYTRADCQRFMSDTNHFCPFYVSLRDRCGDYGLIGIVVSEIADGALLIREFVMSCRVLKRGVEQEICNHLARWAMNRGLSQIEGEYRATAKNAMVADLYPRLGFDAVEPDGPGKRWRLDVSTYHFIPTWIRVED